FRRTLRFFLEGQAKLRRSVVRDRGQGRNGGRETRLVFHDEGAALGGHLDGGCAGAVGRAPSREECGRKHEEGRQIGVAGARSFGGGGGPGLKGKGGPG